MRGRGSFTKQGGSQCSVERGAAVSGRGKQNPSGRLACSVCSCNAGATPVCGGKEGANRYVRVTICRCMPQSSIVFVS